MSAFHDKYQRLARGPLGLSSLWLGEDHLVYVKGSGFLMPFTEEYKRFRLSEIQALSVAKTSRSGTLLLQLCGLLGGAGIAALILWLSEPPGPVAIVAVSLCFALALAAAALLLRNLVLGPACICDLQTRLSRERIRPLHRYHRALETVRRIEGRVRESQASSIVAEASIGEGEGSLLKLPAAARADFFTVPVVATASFGACLALGVAGLAALHLESLALTAAVLLLLLGSSLVLVMALIAVVRKPTPESIRAVLWTLLGLDFLVTGIGSVYFLVVAAGEPAYTVGLTGPLEAYTALASEGGLALYGGFVGMFIGFAAAGVAGLALGVKWRGRIARARSLEVVRAAGEGEPGSR